MDLFDIDRVKLSIAPLSPMEAFLIVCPESLISPHFKVMLRLAQVLAPLGRCYFLRCDGREHRCVFRDSNPAHPHFRDQPIDKTICQLCLSQFDDLTSQASLHSIPITIRFHRDFGINSPLPTAVTDQLLVAAKSLIFKSDIRGFNESELDLKDGWEHTSRELIFNTENAILENKITRVFVFGQYIQPLSAFIAARRRYRRAYIVDCPLVGEVRYNFIRLRTMPSMDLNVSYHRESFEHSYNEKSYLDNHGFTLALTHVKGLINKSSPWVYSSPPTSTDLKSLKIDLNIPMNAKVLTAFISSPDELLASLALSKAFESFGLIESCYEPTFLFRDQIDWLDWLNQIASQHNDLIVFARTHPRLGEDPRSGIASTFLNTLKENSKEWKHVRLIMPEHPVSSYDLMAVSDAVTSIWSSTALEATYFGIPAVIPSVDSPTYPRRGSGVTLTPTISDYQGAIEFALEVGLDRKATIERWYESLNWLAFTLKCSMGIDIGHFDSDEQRIDESVNELVRLINLTDSPKPPELDSVDWPAFPDIESVFERYLHSLHEYSSVSVLRGLLSKTSRGL
jgi:hypothetical protein